MTTTEIAASIDQRPDEAKGEIARLWLCTLSAATVGAASQVDSPAASRGATGMSP